MIDSELEKLGAIGKLMSEIFADMQIPAFERSRLHDIRKQWQSHVPFPLREDYHILEGLGDPPYLPEIVESLASDGIGLFPAAQELFTNHLQLPKVISAAVVLSVPWASFMLTGHGLMAMTIDLAGAALLSDYQLGETLWVRFMQRVAIANAVTISNGDLIVMGSIFSDYVVEGYTKPSRQLLAPPSSTDLQRIWWKLLLVKD